MADLSADSYPTESKQGLFSLVLNSFLGELKRLLKYKFF